MFVLQDSLETTRRGRPVYLEGMSGIGPKYTESLNNAEVFTSKQKAFQSPAYAHSMCFFEPIAIVCPSTSKTETDNSLKVADDKIVEVCSECNQASCWYGEFMCCESQNASTIKKTVGELRELKLEHEEYWSDKKMLAIYGNAAPFGYR